jgi:metallo-beta-lactamase family protein
LHHLENGIGDPANTVILVSFQAEHTLGRRLQEGDKEVRIFGEQYSVRAKVANVGGFSAHADRDDLLWWVGEATAHVKQVFVVHGETHTAEALVASLKEAGIAQVSAPKPGDSITL